MVIKGSLKVIDWNEADVVGNIFRVSAMFGAMGDLVGVLRVEYMMYTIAQRLDDGGTHIDGAVYRGFLIFEGKMDGVVGSFALADAGVYTKAGPESRFSVVPDSGTGGFKGVSGYGKYFPGESAIGIEMDLELE